MARRESRNSALFPGERQDVEIFLSCRDIKPLDRFRGINTGIALYIERNGKYELDEQTEKIKGNPNPDFKKSFNLEFFFAVRQNLKLIISDFSPDGSEKVVGEVYTNVGQILGSKNQTIGFNITKDKKRDAAVLGRLIIRAERVNYISDIAKLTMKARQIKVSKGLFTKPSTDFVIKLYRFLGDAGYGLVYESEIRKNENPRWSEIEITLQKLSNGDYDRKIKAQVINCNSNGGNVVVGEGFFTVNNLLSNQLLDYEIDLINPKNQQKSGVLVVDNFDLIEKPHFLDYLHAGLQFNLMIGIDYTSSNKDPFTVDSLHTIVNAEEQNAYQKAMAGVCEILLNYDYDKKVLMYGFGGIPNFPNFKSELTSHCFPLTGDLANPWAEHLDGIMKVYRNSFNHVELASPTYFEPIIRQAMQIAKKNKEKESTEYTILLMLTDGKCHDMQDSINAVIGSAFLPLSIIIVGVGDADFKKMEILDGDEGLANFKGEQAARDLVQFVPFRDFENNPDLLAKNVLAEIPNQVVTYMLSQGIKPNGLLSEDFKSIYKTVYTGVVDDESSEEKKDENFCNTTSWIENTSHHFSKALEFMKKENNVSFVSTVRQNSPPNSPLRLSKTTSFANKQDQKIVKHDQNRNNQSFY